MRDQAEALRRMVKGKSAVDPRIIAVTSGKGGVGKTNIAVSLSLCLAKAGHRVALIDADLGLANVDIVLGLSPEYTLGDVLKGEKTFDEIALTGPYDLKVFAGGSGFYELANLNQERLEQFIAAVDQIDKQFEFIFIDTGGGIHRNVLSFVLAVREVVIVTTPEPPAIADAYGMIKVIKQKNPDAKVKLVVNMAKTSKEGELVWQKLNTVLRQFIKAEVEYAGHILYDPIVGRSVTQQKSFFLNAPTSLASRNIEQLAASFIQKEPTKNQDGKGMRGLLGRVYSLLQS